MQELHTSMTHPGNIKSVFITSMYSSIFKVRGKLSCGVTTFDFTCYLDNVENVMRHFKLKVLNLTLTFLGRGLGLSVARQVLGRCSARAGAPGPRHPPSTSVSMAASANATSSASSSPALSATPSLNVNNIVNIRETEGK